MRDAFRKGVIRSIRGSIGRFLAIAGIVALGCGFYAGLRMTAPDMRIAADSFYDGTYLHDIRLLSTLGFSDAQVDEVASVEGVEAVMPARSTDVMAMLDGEQYAMRVSSLPADVASRSTSDDGVSVVSDDGSYLNRLVLAEGSWPVSEGECVLSADRVMSTPVQLGDEVQVLYGSQDLDGVLDVRTYRVVGFVHSSSYVSSVSLGSTQLGSGTIQQYLYVSPDNFSSDYPYSELYVRVAGAADEVSGSDAYQEKVDAVSNRLEDLSGRLASDRADEVRDAAQDELDAKKDDYAEQKASATVQLDDAKAQLDAAAHTLQESEDRIADGQAAYDDGAAQLAAARESTSAQLADAAAQLDAASAQLDQQSAQLDTAQAQLDAGRTQWQTGTSQMLTALQGQGITAGSLAEAGSALQTTIAALQQADPTDARIPVLQGLLSQVQGLIDTGTQLDGQQAQIDGGRAQIEAGRQQVVAGRAELVQRSSDAWATIDASQAQLDASAAQLDDACRQLADGRATYETNLVAWQTSKADADRSLADAQSAIDDAQKTIDDIADPTVYVLDRTRNYGVASFDSDAGRVDNIAKVFPFIFFLVAALVALTTMTRMVDEERGLIGTYKALGYSRARITGRYLVYAGVASLTGSAIGIIVLSQVLPVIICRAYAIIYNVPQQLLPLPIDMPIALLSAGLGVGVTLGATWAAVTSTLRETPATLMLPRAPKAGKRILLERITPIWHRLSFSWKVTCRNIFRYRKRLWMTIIGVAGCTALLLTGLGLHDAIWDIIDNQYGDIVHYNVVVDLSDDATADDIDEVQAIMGSEGDATDVTRAQSENLQMGSASHDPKAVQVVVPSDVDAFADLLTMRVRTTGNAITMDGDSVVLSEKLATILGVQVGDTVVLYGQDEIGNAEGDGGALTVTAIMENYVGDFVYLGRDAYESATGETPPFTAIYARCTTDTAQRETMTDDLHGVDMVDTVAFNDEVIDNYRKMLSSVDMIVVVLVVAAAALAFIVLYNLININITERRREIASLKVLGFTPREVDAYIFREIGLLSVFGAGLGLVLGIFLERFVVVSSEVDQVMFGRAIHPASFLIAFLCTLVFSAVIMFLMRHKLDEIDMVESLKSVE